MHLRIFVSYFLGPPCPADSVIWEAQQATAAWKHYSTVIQKKDNAFPPNPIFFFSEME